jgi:endothelin-converting enzyme
VLKYGAFGAVAGHELSHAFDSSGRNYDQNGNYTDWWDKSTIEAFKKKTDCFVEQYHNYTVPTKNGRLPINGKLTLGENIADAGGLTAAYQSWKRRDDEKADRMLPGLDHFTKEQIFFLAYGQTWCGKMRYVNHRHLNIVIALTQYREEQIVQRIYTDPHSPDMFRIKVRGLILIGLSILTAIRVQLPTRASLERLSAVPSKHQLVSSGERDYDPSWTMASWSKCMI